MSTDRLDWNRAIRGSRIVAGAPGATIGFNSGQGAAYVFVKPAGGWKDMTQTAKVTSSDGQAYDGFGYSVAIDGSTVVCGAPFAPYDFSKSRQGPGLAYVFGNR